MKLRSLLAATIVFGSSLVFAQVCPSTPGSVCLVPSSSTIRSQATTYTMPSTMTSTVTTVPYSGTMSAVPIYTASGTCPMMTGTGQTCPMMTGAQTCPMMGSTNVSALPAYGTTPIVVPYTGSNYSMAPTTGFTPIYPSTFASAQICPTTGSTFSTIPTYSYQAMATPYYGNVASAPMITSQQFATCPNISPDTAYLSNQVVGLRSDIRSLQGSVIASNIQMQGQNLVSRTNQLMADEMLFRQQLAANPNLPDAQMRAFQLSQQANALNSDLAAFNQQLSMIPVDQRPYLASSLNGFTVAYWDPTMQQFSMYRTQFMAQAPTAYQPAIAANPWLTNWQSTYSTSLNNIASVPQTYASVNWWGTSRVLGSTEMYPGGTMMVPAGVVYVPAGSIAACQPGMMSSTMYTTMPTTAMGTTPMTMPTTATNTTTTTTTATGTTSVTTPEATATTTTTVTPTTQPGIGY